MCTRTARSILAAVAVVALGGHLHAMERHVPGEYPTIQAAVDACVDGDVIVLAPGTYTGNGNTDVYVPSLTITIRSVDGDPNACVIDGEGARSGITVIGENDQVASINALTFTNCIDSSSGGALTVNAINATQPSRVMVTNCRFTHNQSTSTDGGAVYAYGQVEIYNCYFAANSAAGFGGAVIMGHGATIERCVIVDNEALSGGGLLAGHAVTVRHCSIQRNVAHGDGGIGLGGAILVGGDDHVIASCLIADNEAERGGGIHIGGLGASSGTRLSHCEIRGNLARGLGGGICAEDSGEQPISNCLIVGNQSAYYGGGVYVVDEPVSFIGCTVSDNNCDSYGGGVYALGNAPLNFHNGILHGNTAAVGAEIAVETLRVFHISHTSISNVQHVWFGSGAYIDWGDAVIEADPAFSDPPQDYRLSLDSPCIDAGSNDLIPPDRADVDEDEDFDEQVPWDLDASQRVMRGLVDLGPYEIPFGDLNCDKALNNGDIDPFVLAITDPAAYGREYPECVREYADMNADGLVNNGDIDAFVALLGG